MDSEYLCWFCIYLCIMACSTSLTVYLSTLNMVAYAVSFNLSTQQSRFSLLFGPNENRSKMIPRAEKCLSLLDQIIHLALISVYSENHKFPSALPGFILVSLLPEGTSISTSAVPQSISAWPNLGEFSARSYLCRHTPVCVLGQHVSRVFRGDRNNEFMRSSINLSLMGWNRLSLSLQCTQ